MSSFHAGVTIGLNVSSAVEVTGGAVVEGGDVGDAGGWGCLEDLVPGLDGLLSEWRGG